MWLKKYLILTMKLKLRKGKIKMLGFRKTVKTINDYHILVQANKKDYKPILSLKVSTHDWGKQSYRIIASQNLK